jgi:hypothetical protein
MDGDYDFNVMMDLDDEFARDHGGYSGYAIAGPVPYDPTFNPHGVGAYSDYDSADYGFDPDQNDEFEDWQRPNVNNEEASRPTNTSNPPQEQIQVSSEGHLN